jgi:ssDNA-binding Zn-finger/Zn-ribbon topoisomerase 1
MTAWDPSQPDRRTGHDRRGYWRGGRRRSDWPATLTTNPVCPRCDSHEAKFVEGTPDTLFWGCHRCHHEWSTTPEGQLIVE